MLSEGILLHTAVLAGGKSSRMRTDKRFLEIHGEFLVDRAIRLAGEVVDPYGGKVYLCGNVPGRECLPDMATGRGPVAGLWSVFNIISCPESREQAPWLAVLPIDMPFLSVDLLKRLIVEIKETKLIERAVAFENFELPFLLRCDSFAIRVLKDLYFGKDLRRRSIRILQESVGLKAVKLGSRWQSSMSNMNYPSDWNRVCKRESS